MSYRRSKATTERIRRQIEAMRRGKELWDRANADDAADEVHHAFARLLERAHGIGA